MCPQGSTVVSTVPLIADLVLVCVLALAGRAAAESDENSKPGTIIGIDLGTTYGPNTTRMLLAAVKH